MGVPLPGTSPVGARKVPGAAGLLRKNDAIVVASPCNDEIDKTVGVEIGGEHADEGAVVVGRNRQVGGWKKMAGFVGERDDQGIGVALHAGDVGDAVVVEVGDHDVREHVIVAVDREVDRLGVAKGAGGGVGPGGDGERDGGTVGRRPQVA